MEDLVISYLHSEIREINDAWIKEQYGEPIEISATTVESPRQDDEVPTPHIPKEYWKREAD